MLVLLMCGGRGRRLGVGEKPLFRVCGSPLVDHSLRQFSDFEVIAVTSPYTPRTEDYLKSRGIEVFRAAGRGFVEDFRETCISYAICEPVIVAAADIVYFRDVADEIVRSYMASSAKALRVEVCGSPLGVNVIDAFFLDFEQEEDIFTLGKNDVLNVNTIEDARRAERLWTSTKRDVGGSRRG